MLRGMKVLFLLLIFCCWAGSAQGAASAPRPAKGTSKPTARAAPAIEIPETTFDFGEAFEGVEVEHDFVVKNTGKAELLIDQVRPG